MVVIRTLICFLLIDHFLVEGLLNPDYADSSEIKSIVDKWWEERIKQNRTKSASLLSTNPEPKPDYEEPETATTTPLPPTCLSNMSLHTENDINDMIDHQIKENGVADHINGSFYASFKLIRDTHEQRLNGFLDWFHHRPEHLKHILQFLEHTRFRLNPFVKKIQNNLQKYSELEISFNSKIEQVERLHKKLQNHKVLCELSCEDKNTELLLTTHYFLYNNYICSSIADLFNNVNRNIRKEMNVTESKLMNDQINLDLILKNDINVVINKLKDAALKQFGRTMYDILELQDKYIHFEELLESDFESMITEIEEKIDYTTLKLKELERTVDKVRVQCTKCNNKYNMLTSLRSKTLNTRQDENENIVAKLVSLKMQSLVNIIKEKLQESFVSLFTNINENNVSIDKIIDELKPIQNEIAYMTKDETEQLEQLQATVSQLSASKFLELLKKLILLLKSLIEIENESNNLIEYYKS